MNADGVARWLSQVASSASQSRKRHLPSPPRSRQSGAVVALDIDPPPHSDNALGRTTPDHKRRRTRAPDNDPDVDATPRAASLVDRPHFGSSASARSQVSSGHASSGSASRRSSPTKRLLSLGLGDDGVIPRMLSTDAEGLPPQLRDLMGDFELISRGAAAISSAHKDEIKALVRVPDWMFASPDERDMLGPTPPIAAVKAVLSWSRHCHETFAHEHAWNCAVHFPLLSLALYGGSARTNQFLGFDPCTTASIIETYLPNRAGAKKIDFCISIDPTSASDPGAAESIETLRKALPLHSVNHTDHAALQSRPIAISIETKRTGQSDEEAALQIGTWQAAQWNLLTHLVNLCRQRDLEDNSNDDRWTTEQPSLPFLPAVIIHGHEWRLAATTREGKKTILWTDYPFGSTRDVMGIYQIIMGLQRLNRFVTDTFWPWYRAYVLGLNNEP